MNEERRKRISNVCSLLHEASVKLMTIHYDELYAFENMPENLQNSRKGIAISEAVDTLEEQVSALEDIIVALEEFEK